MFYDLYPDITQIQTQAMKSFTELIQPIESDMKIIFTLPGFELESPAPESD